MSLGKCLGPRYNEMTAGHKVLSDHYRQVEGLGFRARLAASVGLASAARGAGRTWIASTVLS